MLTPAEKQRYARHFTLPEVGEEGQVRLKNSSVLCIGTGGPGSPVAMYLAAAGVGNIGLVDDDHVESSNLQRHFRDIHVATQHIMVAPSTLETTGRLFLGLPTNTATL